ncbi:hypothetical protein LR48_Vigan08g010200 [Vigna angularis]|uniref:Uncharacterized protein n=1 Tax=Phaseolus angularis TaxID=3914 RepID=A0A0L9V2B8_PHAAN|nr:hypothetical protein LR48_Vigan08g010200 [Vigna angularis]
MAEQGSAAVNDGEIEPQQNKHHVLNSHNDNNDVDNKDESSDPELFCCLLQPATADRDPEYIGIRRLLLLRKAEAGIIHRRDWRCNGKTYVAYRNYLSRPRNWERDSSRAPSLHSTPGNSGRFFPSPSPHSRWSEVDSLSSGRDLQNANPVHNHRSSFGSSVSDSDPPRHRRAESAYSFVGMHCIFDKCKASVSVLKFGHKSSDLLAYGAADGTLTVCNVSENPSVIKQLEGHSKNVTDFDFTSNNQYIASSSWDKTVRVWEIAKGICIRVIYGVCPQLCIRFHPVFNFSTGRVINKSLFDSGVTSLDHDHTGLLLFCGDAQGHGFPVLGIAWNHGENLLASSDFYGVVIVWKRERTNQNNHTQQQ